MGDRVERSKMFGFGNPRPRLANARVTLAYTSNCTANSLAPFTLFLIAHLKGNIELGINGEARIDA